MSEAPLMVGVSGLRGIVGKSLTPEVAARFAGAFGGWLRAANLQGSKAAHATRPSVVVGADGRAGYVTVHRAAIDGLLAAGCDVIDLGVCMTPTTGLMVDHLDAAGGMIVTASHNPQEWNGLKCLVRQTTQTSGETDQLSYTSSTSNPACAPPPALAEQIIARFRSDEPRVGGARGERFHRADAVRLHVDAVTSGIGPDIKAVRARRFRVVVDSVNSSGIEGTRELLTRLGCELIHRGSEPTGVFPHPPEPTRENLESLCSAVTKFAADAGFAQDPDADRLAIVDERGEYIGEEYTLVLAAVALLQARRNAAGMPKSAPTTTDDVVLVTNLSTSRMIDDVARLFHARVVRTPVGEANVVEAMKREAAASGLLDGAENATNPLQHPALAAGAHVVLGGEGNGGVIWPGVTYVRDSLSAMALTLALMARTGRKLSELIADLPNYAIEKRKVDLARKEDAQPAVAKIAAAYNDAKIDTQDGVRVDWQDRRSWLHVRASNTEPIMRLIAEAPTAEEARTILDDAARIIAG